MSRARPREPAEENLPRPEELSESEESVSEGSISLEFDLDGTFLVDPLDIDSGSLHTVASFSYEYRVSPDTMPVSRDKTVKQWRKCQLLWEDHYEDITVDEIMPFQYQPSIQELTD